MLGRELVDQSHPMAKTPVRWWPPLADSKAPGRDPAWGAAQELYELVFPGAGLRRGPVPTVRQLLEVMHFNVMTSCWEHRSALLFKVSESPYEDEFELGSTRPMHEPRLKVFIEPALGLRQRLDVGDEGLVVVAAQHCQPVGVLG
jgi:hypothetical protein